MYEEHLVQRVTPGRSSNVSGPPCPCHRHLPTPRVRIPPSTLADTSDLEVTYVSPRLLRPVTGDSRPSRLSAQSWDCGLQRVMRAPASSALGLPPAGALCGAYVIILRWRCNLSPGVVVIDSSLPNGPPSTCGISGRRPRGFRLSFLCCRCQGYRNDESLGNHDVIH